MNYVRSGPSKKRGLWAFNPSSLEFQVSQARREKFTTMSSSTLLVQHWLSSSRICVLCGIKLGNNNTWRKQNNKGSSIPPIPWFSQFEAHWNFGNGNEKSNHDLRHWNSKAIMISTSYYSSVLVLPRLGFFSTAVLHDWQLAGRIGSTVPVTIQHVPTILETLDCWALNHGYPHVSLQSFSALMSLLGSVVIDVHMWIIPFIGVEFSHWATPMRLMIFDWWIYFLVFTHVDTQSWLHTQHLNATCTRTVDTKRTRTSITRVSRIPAFYKGRRSTAEEGERGGEELLYAWSRISTREEEE